VVRCPALLIRLLLCDIWIRYHQDRGQVIGSGTSTSGLKMEKVLTHFMP